MRRTAITGFVAALAIGCSSNPGIGAEGRRYEAELYREDFIEFRARCLQQNGRIFVDAKHTLPRQGIPRPGDRYYCI